MNLRPTCLPNQAGVTSAPVSINTPLALNEGKSPRVLPSLSRVCAGEHLPSPPIWLMRQAGRYLPEYRKARAAFPDFVRFCMTPEAAATVTLQPVERYDLDAAVIFSDILIPFLAAGCEPTYGQGEAPKVYEKKGAFAQFDFSLLEPVYEALRIVRGALPPGKSLIGFCGAPWTMWLYLNARDGSKDFLDARKLAVSDVEAVKAKLARIVDLTAAHAVAQVKAGADTLQFFDSWAGLCPAFLRDAFVTEPTRALIRKVKAACPHVNVICFAKGLGPDWAAHVKKVGADAASADPVLSPEYVAEALPEHFPVQGGVDPLALFAGKETIRAEAARCARAFASRPYIAGLSHGVLVGTDPDAVGYLIDRFREETA